MKWMSVEFVESFCGKRDIFKLDKTHRSILFGPEAKSLVSSLLGKHSFELIFRGINRQVPNVQGIAWGVLVGRVNRWIVRALIVLATELMIHCRTTHRSH